MPQEQLGLRMAPLLCGDPGHLRPSGGPYQQQRPRQRGGAPLGCADYRGALIAPTQPGPRTGPVQSLQRPSGTSKAGQPLLELSCRAAEGACAHCLSPSTRRGVWNSGSSRGQAAWSRLLGETTPPGEGSIPRSEDSSRSQWPSVGNQPWVFRTHALVLSTFF